ncbi:hypothetical protein [Lentibacillus sediminis]|uniref:hypothetical protein n=1 Tax=Lentibacillus sediminis TaxID=1940529 RepID=UPI000C1C25A0|nr:hypothetical protein [Lentibacillus sediminis]
MGYILPITHYQYNDYQNRITEQKRVPYMVERPFKVVLEKQHEEINSEYERLNISGDNADDMAIQAANARPEAEKVYGDLTGKGTNFSSSV